VFKEIKTEQDRVSENRVKRSRKDRRDLLIGTIAVAVASLLSIPALLLHWGFSYVIVIAGFGAIICMVIIVDGIRFAITSKSFLAQAEYRNGNWIEN